MLSVRTPFLLACLYFLYLLSSAAERNPPCPIISETFTSEVNLSIANTTGNYTVVGKGHISREESQAKQLIDLQLTKYIGHPVLLLYLQLKRYDLKKIFDLTQNIRQETHHCQISAFKGPFGELWGWVNNAMYVGTVTEKGHKCEVWNYTVTDLTKSLWVNQSQRGQPIRYILDTKHESTIVVNFEVFKPIAPTDPNEYDVPNLCQTPLPTAKNILNFSRDFDDIED